MEYAYVCVLRGVVRGKRWWNLPKDATMACMGTVEPVPGSTRAEVMGTVVRQTQRDHPELLASYMVGLSLEPNNVLVPVPEQPPVVDTGVIPAVREDADSERP